MFLFGMVAGGAVSLLTANAAQLGGWVQVMTLLGVMALLVITATERHA